MNRRLISTIRTLAFACVGIVVLHPTSALATDTIWMSNAYGNNTIYVQRTLTCGSDLIIYDKGGPDATGSYYGGESRYCYLKTDGTGTPIHITIEADLAYNTRLTMFNQYPANDHAVPTFPFNDPNTRIFMSSDSYRNFTTSLVSTTGVLTIKYQNFYANTTVNSNYKIHVWVSDTSEVYDIQNSAITQTSAQLTWSDSSDATEWQLLYGTSEDNLSQSVTTTTPTATLTGLTSNTLYYVRVCNNSNTTVSTSGYCTPNTTMFITKGETDPPEGCIGDFTDLSSEHVLCTYGFYSNPMQTVGVSANRHTVITDTEGHDPLIGDSLSLVPDGATASVRIGNSNAGNEAESVIYRFRVDASQNDILLLRYASVMQNPVSHTPDIQPRFELKILRENGEELNDLCYKATFVSSSVSGAESDWHDHGPLSGMQTHTLWHDWTSVGVDLTPLDGEVLYVMLITRDCNENANDHSGTHFSYAYYTLTCEKKSISYQACSDQEISSFTAPEGFLYDWHVANSSSTLSTSRTFAPPQDATDIYECTMTFRGASNAECSFNMTVNPSASGQYPQASFTAAAEVNSGEPLEFVNTSYFSSDAAGENPLEGTSGFSYSWSFGDGNSSILKNPVHTFPVELEDRTYTVTLVASIGEDCSSEYQTTVLVKAGASTETDYPDNVDQELCSFPVESTQWSIAIDDMMGHGNSFDSICTLISPLVGDLDGDGIPEIVCFATRNASSSTIDGSGNPGTKVKSVVVYDGQTHHRKAAFDLPSYVSAFEATPFGLAKPYDGDALMVFACTNNQLYAYKLNGSGGATQVWGGVSYGSGTDYATTVGFADFNNDSIPEVYVRNRIFNLTTGELLLMVGSGNSGSTYAHVGNASASGRKPLAASLAFDVVGDSKCEMLLGNEIYSIFISNIHGTVGNSATLYATAPSTGVSGISNDGHVQVADFNLDGHIDLFFSSRPSQQNSASVYGYVWDVYNNSVSEPIVQAVTAPGKSIPLIADIDNDDSLEVVLHCGVAGANVRAYKYHAVTQSFSLLWTRGFNEDSYSNGLTLFDFNQDGESELLICDQNNISIVNGSSATLAQQTLATFPFKEVTIMQYPVIADVDNDGAAEIVFVGRQNNMSIQGTLNILRSDGMPWAPARPVWNQYMYNVTNVNKDLTIPAVLFNNAHTFVDNTGSTPVLRRPYNNFLQQATMIDTNGVPYMVAADLTSEGSSIALVDGGLAVTFSVCNQGQASFLTDTLYIQIYVDSVGGPQVAKIILVNAEGGSFTIDPESCEPTAQLIPYERLCSFMPFDSLVFAINDKGEGVAVGGLPPECNIDNNYFILPNLIEVVRDTVRDTVCQGVAYEGHGFSIDASRTATAGWITDSIVTTASCANVTLLQLYVMASESFDTAVSACDSYTWQGTTYDQSGTYSVTESTAAGCSRVLTLNLTVESSYHVDEEVAACDSYQWFGTRYTRSGDYRHQGTTAFGCDSIVTLHLTIAYSDTTRFDQRISCLPVVWHGTTYEATGRYTYESTTDEGCLYREILDLTIREATINSLSQSACDYYIWYGERYEASGVYTHETADGEGCLTVEKLQLTINPSYHLNDAVDFCQGETVVIGGQNVSTSGNYTSTYTTAAQCDSIVVTTATARPVYNYVDSVRLCSSDPSVGYHWVDGNTYYRTTDLPQCSFTTVYGCDSILKLSLVIDRSLRSVIHCEPEYPTVDNPEVCLTDATSGNVSRHWYLFDGTETEDYSICFTMPLNVDSVMVQLVTSSLSGCFDTAVIYIPMDRSAIYIPNTFTPNLATNARFGAYGQGILEFEMMIFNREGLLVKELKGLDDRWDGTSKDKKCPQGVYAYRARYRTVGRPNEWQVVIGTVTLLR